MARLRNVVIRRSVARAKSIADEGLRPDFFIVGAPKCGTSAMHHALRQHPDLFLPWAKELHFFGRDLDFRRERLSEAQYLAYFRKAQRGQQCGEAAIWYLYSEAATREIERFSPSARILIMLRNPVDMMYALHSQHVYNGYEDLVDFEAALRAEANRKRGLQIPPGRFLAEGLFYRQKASYTAHVRRYMEVFGRERIHIILFDDFVRFPERVFRGVFTFLGVASDFVPRPGMRNPNKTVHSRLMRRLLLEVPPPIRWVGRTLLAPAARRRLSEAAWAWNTRNVPRAPMSPSLRALLQTEFADEVSQLGHLLERDLSHWSVPQVPRDDEGRFA